MKKVILFSIVLFVGIMFSSCDKEGKTTSDSDRKQSQETEKLSLESNRQVGMPAIVNFQEKKLLKWIYELCDQEELICYAYYFNAFEGKRGDFIGKCLGYGIPYSTQFSNSNKIVDAESYLNISLFEDNGRTQVLSQSEPNGIFKPEGMSATWLIMIDEKGDPRPMYVEPAIIVSPFPLHELKESKVVVKNSPNSVAVQGDNNSIN